MHAYLQISAFTPTKDEFESVLGVKYVNFLEFSVSTILEVRNLKKSFLFKPQGSALVLLTGIEISKQEAQNALLKILEEPPHANITFVVLSKNEHLVLPTILSRLSVLPHKKVLAGSHTEVNFPALGKITDREAAIEKLEGIIASSKVELATRERAVLTLANLKRNGSVVLQLTNFVLQLEAYL